ncbi:MAG: 3'-5' exonuclease [bacterium]
MVFNLFNLPEENKTEEETYLFFDTETTGLPKDYKAPVTKLDNWPRLVQIAWLFYGKSGNLISEGSYIIKPEGFDIPIVSSNIHGITTEIAEKSGVPLDGVLSEFDKLVNKSTYLIAHNISFDEKIVGAEFLRKKMANNLPSKKTICTKDVSTNYCAINGKFGFKWPTLQELHNKLFGENFVESHNAIADIAATAKCFWELRKRGVV